MNAMKTMVLVGTLGLGAGPAQANDAQLQTALGQVQAVRDPRDLRQVMGRFNALVSQATQSESEAMARANWEWRYARPRLGDPRESARAALSDAERTARWRLSSAIGDRLLDMYRPGGPLSHQLTADLDMMTPNGAGRVYWYTGHIVYQYLNDRSVNPMGFDAGARWFRDRLTELRAAAPRQSPSIGAAPSQASPSGLFWLGPPNINMDNPDRSTGVGWWLLNNVGGAMVPGNIQAGPVGGNLSARQMPWPPR
ncbi:MAG: hypothetical protein HY928_05365 [Elusimicrobia bacterium]|nr:hypothetical protein [Elusimicrobiota bacterium]